MAEFDYYITKGFIHPDIDPARLQTFLLTLEHICQDWELSMLITQSNFGYGWEMSGDTEIMAQALNILVNDIGIPFPYEYRPTVQADPPPFYIEKSLVDLPFAE